MGRTLYATISVVAIAVLRGSAISQSGVQAKAKGLIVVRFSNFSDEVTYLHERRGLEPG